MSESDGSDTSVETVKSGQRGKEKINYFENEIEDIVKRLVMSTSFIGQIEFFSAGDNFNEYIERMEKILEINKVKDDQYVSYLIGLGGGDLYKIIKSVAAPQLPTQLTYANLKTTLKGYFEPKRNVIGERFIFHRRQQKADENISDYIVEIKSLSQNCEFGTFLDEALRDKLIFGVNSTKIQRRLINEKELKFDKACEIAKMMEKTEENLNEMNQGETVAAFGRKNYKQSKDNRKGDKSVFSRLSAKTGGKEKNKRYGNYQCFLCGMKGHIVKNCYKNPNRENKKEGKPNSIKMNTDDSDDESMGHINNVLSKGPFLLEVSVNKTLIKMEIDTGACRTVMHIEDKNKYFPNLVINNCAKRLFSVSGEKLKILGACTVIVDDLQEKTRAHKCELIVVDSMRKFVPLLGRDWLDTLYSHWRNKLAINSVQSESKAVNTDVVIRNLKSKFPAVFSSVAAGTIKNFKVELNLTENAHPIFFKPYSVPYGKRDAVEHEIKRLCELNILYPVRHSAWASPIVIVDKPDGSIRLCVDCKVTINKFLKADHYPLPRIDDILANLRNAKYFCVLDLREAYSQMEVSENSQEFLTINTHIGLFRYRRLIFGVSCAPSIFQSMMDQIIQGLKRVMCFIDDLLIGGETLEECKENLMKVIERFNEYNVKIKLEKCKFFQKSVIYLGHEISGEGVRPNKEKVKAIIGAPCPQNLTQLKSYLGLINYYGRFIPNLSHELIALYKLTKKNTKFIWSDECQRAFQRSKDLLLSNDLLVHYDPAKPIVIHCDASPYGLGAILSHVIKGKDKPVLFASCTLTKTQQNYAQLHREALAVVFAVKKFHKYIFGKSFVIYSDHQPLRDIFNAQKSMPVAAGRLQRWAIFLAMYNYHMEYKKGSKLGNADALSRLPLSDENDIEHQNIHSFSENTPIDVQQVALHTQNDMVLKEISQKILMGWKHSDSEHEHIRPYYNKRLMLSVENNCIYYGTRLLIPNSLKVNILNLLHDTHIGVLRMKTTARSYVWWLSIDKDIEAFARQCEACQLNQNSSSKVPLTKWKNTNVFFERIHIDFFHLKNQTYLILVDTYSRWVDVKMMKTTTSSKLIDELRTIFAYFGLPKEIVSDNGPPFNAKEFQRFCANNNIACTKSPPYHPQSNGWAECGVRIVKQSLRKMFMETKNANCSVLLSRFLFKHRNTPVTTTGETPSDRIFRFRPTTLMDVLTSRAPPSQNTSKTTTTTINNKKETESNKIKLFELNELVLYRNEFKNDVKWLKAKIIKIHSPCRYRILLLTRGSMRDCHGDQLRTFNEKKFKSNLPTTSCRTAEETEESENGEEPPEINEEPTTVRRAERLKNKPKVNYYETKVRQRKRN